jgi:hypothetical protein
VVGSIEHIDDGSALGQPDAVNMAVNELTALDRLIKGERVQVETTPLDSMLQEVK